MVFGAQRRDGAGAGGQRGGGVIHGGLGGEDGEGSGASVSRGAQLQEQGLLYTGKSEVRTQLITS